MAQSEVDRGRDYRTGFLLTVLGVLLLTPDALMLRLIGADSWTMVFWRGFLIPCTILTVVGFRGGFDTQWRDFRSGGATSYWIALSYGVITLCFTTALSHTSVAHVLVILAAAPLFAAILSMPILGERSGPVTWTAIAIGVCGIALMVSEEDGAASLLGDGLALIAAIGLAFTFVLIRRQKDLNTIPSVCLGGFMAGVVALPFASPLMLSAGQAQLILLLCIGILPLSFALIAIGPKRVPAPEVGLLMLLETVLGPLWVWLFLDEVPTDRALLGGGIVIAALAGHAIWRLTRRDKKAEKQGLGSIFDGLTEEEIKRLGG